MLRGKNILVLAFLLFLPLSFYFVSALAVTAPILEYSSLERGESVRFYFTIQGKNLQNPVKCSYSISGLEPLKVNFDTSEIVVNPGEDKKVYGTLTVPSNAPFDTYNEGKLYVSCKPVEELTGSVIVNSGILLFPSISVKEKVERPQPQPQPLPTPTPTTPSYNLTLAVIGVVVILIAVGAIYWMKKKST